MSGDIDIKLKRWLLLLTNVIGSRAAGSQQDKQALLVMKNHFEKLGLETTIENFIFWAYVPRIWSLSVDNETIPCLPCVCSKSTDVSPVRGSVVDVGYGSLDELTDVKGKVILARIGRVHESFKAEAAVKKGAIGMLLFSEDDPDGIYTGRVTYPIGPLPSVCISKNDGLLISSLSKRRSAKAEITIGADTKRSVGRNLIAKLPGQATLTDESIMVTAHRDSRRFSPGANDNGSGCAVMMEMARLMVDKQRKRSIVFFSTDAEEYGCQGSSRFVQRHYPYLTRSCVGALNFDSVGQGKPHLVGRDREGALSSVLNKYCEIAGKKMGETIGHRDHPGGSDCDSFARTGINASWIRCWPSSSFNTTTDSFEKLDYDVMSRICKLGELILDRLASSSGKI